MMRRREFVTLLAGAAAWPFGARAQAVNKLVRIIVGFPAGGGTDIVARILAEAIQGHYAASIIVEDRPGASGRLAVEYVKNAPPDGSVMLFTPDFPMTLYPHSFKSLNYDPVKDFVAAGAVAKSMLAFSIGPEVSDDVKTLAGFVQWCKAHPDKANYADTSAGATPHFTGVMFARAAGIAMTPVHYRGGAPALEDLLGGHIPASVNPLSEIIETAKSGSIRVLAVSGATRSSFLPDVPTFKESGYDVVVESWNGVWLPANTPNDIVQALSAAMHEASKSKAMLDSLAKFATEPAFQTPAQFAETIKSEVARWGPVVKDSGFVALD
jgi:tripartite-type tricarboxylate transporter receptor subunit TctC